MVVAATAVAAEQLAAAATSADVVAAGVGAGRPAAQPPVHLLHRLEEQRGAPRHREAAEKCNLKGDRSTIV